MKHPEFAERFNQAVKDSGVKDTQNALSKLLGVSSVMIWSYKNGEKLPRMEKATHIAQVLGVSVDWLLTGTQSGTHQVNEAPASYATKQYIPVIKWADAANWPNPKIQNERLIPIAEKDASGWFALTVENDSMQPKIPCGAVIGVDPNTKAKSGDLVLAKLPNVEIPTFRRLIEDAGTQQLHPINDRYPSAIAPTGTKILGVIKYAAILNLYD